MTSCLRCGRCCYLIINGKPTNKKCKFLVKLPSGKTLCRIYNRRLGTDLGYNNICIERKNSPYDYEGCPFNTNKPIFEVKDVE